MTSYKKLVRDKIPEIIIKDGKQPITRVLDDQEYLIELVKKLGEEYQEFIVDLSIEELADVQEVVRALADAIASQDELEAVRLDKYHKRGGFKDRIYLESAK